MDVSEKWGTDVDTAVNLALEELEATKDQVKITVLEQPSRGFFGIGSKLALVRVEKLKEETIIKETFEKKEKVDIVEKSCETSNNEILKEEQKEKEEDLVTNKVENNVTEVEKNEALNFLKEVTEQMGLDVSMTCKIENESLFINITGKDAGTIIGKRGQTLDSIQYLTSLVVNNKKGGNYIRVVVDVEDYRAKREKTLERLAKRLGEKVIKTQKSVRLEPMNPYERKVIHATLQKNPKLETRSEGKDPYRRVIIELK